MSDPVRRIGDVRLLDDTDALITPLNPLPVTAVAPPPSVVWSVSPVASPLVNSQVVKATPGTLRDITVRASSAGGARFLQLFNAAALPANGTVPRLSSLPVAAGAVASWDFGTDGLVFSVGIIAALSSTAGTLTLAVAPSTGEFSGRFL